MVDGGFRGIRWDRQRVDGAITKAPLREETEGAGPLRSGGIRHERSLSTDGASVPPSVVVDDAHTHGNPPVEPTLDAVAALRPAPSQTALQHFCADKGYDDPDIRELARAFGYTHYVESPGHEARDLEAVPRYRVRRRVVEPTHPRLNRFPRRLARSKTMAQDVLAVLHFACVFTAFRASRLLK